MEKLVAAIKYQMLESKLGYCFFPHSHYRSSTVKHLYRIKFEKTLGEFPLSVNNEVTREEELALYFFCIFLVNFL